jgi:hypothetical protein
MAGCRLQQVHLPAPQTQARRFANDPLRKSVTNATMYQGRNEACAHNNNKKRHVCHSVSDRKDIIDSARARRTCVHCRMMNKKRTLYTLLAVSAGIGSTKKSNT